MNIIKDAWNIMKDYILKYYDYNIRGDALRQAVYKHWGFIQESFFEEAVIAASSTHAYQILSGRLDNCNYSKFTIVLFWCPARIVDFSRPAPLPLSVLRIGH